ncbi:hypothetical protein CWE09_01005 [Aliidiomarina minuta]|uniref:Uncharacterized protein n=1 Tax=Aliidiomarina minuta TaxID=880057 RepID=A0A432W5J8_9GAMM|nr:hypothetical protein [Aliidiomarina minuta]RUO25345.1 hypothetical protein CWE09_01005 [Aliidiomarina minuta]
MKIATGIFLYSLVLPTNWHTEQVLQGVISQGLKISSWKVLESGARIQSYVKTSLPFCQPLSRPGEEYWHCLSAGFLYSFIPFGDNYLWVQSQPVSNAVEEAYPVEGELIGNYVTEFEQVSVFQSSQHLLALFWQFKRAQQKRGAQLIMLERDQDSFVQQWRYNNKTLVVTGERDTKGGTRLVLSRGSTL